ncbi:MAG: sigma-54-dependent transcriptional regulator [Methylophilaceae bacterium]
MSNNSILIIDDDTLLADNIRLYLERYQWETHVAYSAEDGLKRLEELRPDVLLTDYMLPGKNGIDVINAAKQIDPELKIVMMTGEGNIDIAVDAMKAGANDYVGKPVSLAELKVVLDNLLGQAQVEKTMSVMNRRQARGASLDAIIGDSTPMQAMKSKIRQVLDVEKQIKDSSLPAILINGETGTGKELLARALHFDGMRSNQPFIEINCASLPANLLESELFGHEKGAFTDAKERRIGLVEAAEGGTLFLDEIGEVDLSIQAKLLKLLEEKSVRRIGSVRERKVNIRIISATNQDLEKMVKEGRFRSDLFFRLRVITISPPPLRSLGNDILQLAEHFLQTHGKHYGKKGLKFTPKAQELLLSYGWPGNVREMRNMLEQCVLLAQENEIDADQLTICPSLQIENWNGAVLDRRVPNMAKPVSKVTEDEQELLKRTLEKTDWNVSKTAKILGLSRDMLRYRIEKFRLTMPQQAY